MTQFDTARKDVSPPGPAADVAKCRVLSQSPCVPRQRLGTSGQRPARSLRTRTAALRPLPAPPLAGYPDRVPPSHDSPAGDCMADPTTAYLVAERDDGFGDVYPLQRGVTY